MSREAWIVVDLGFGDAGKGTITDFLVRDRRARWVVRYCGGAQAGHAVVTDDGRAHVFSQLGAGSFVPGVRTHLAAPVVTHPLAMRVEAEALARVGVSDALDRLTVDPQALVITPFHQAAGRLRELARGAAAHGTCGVGIGETVGDAVAHPGDALRFGELWRPGALTAKLTRARERLLAGVSELNGPLDGPLAAPELALLRDAGVAARWIAALGPLTARRGLARDAMDQALARPVVFEGAQGVLLDEWRGFHPHTTWSTCTAENALALLDARAYGGSVRRLGVLRTYATRHGAGPLPTEDPALRIPERHSADAGWQGRFRRGHMDAVLARYALSVCPVDGLAITHLDRAPPRACRAYRVPDDARALFEIEGGLATGIRPGPPRDLGYQRALGAALGRAAPVLEPLGDPAAWAERALGVPVWLGSSGPAAADKAWTGAMATCALT